MRANHPLETSSLVLHSPLMDAIPLVSFVPLPIVQSPPFVSHWPSNPIVVGCSWGVSFVCGHSAPTTGSVEPRTDCSQLSCQARQFLLRVVLRHPMPPLALPNLEVEVSFGLSGEFYVFFLKIYTTHQPLNDKFLPCFAIRLESSSVVQLLSSGFDKVFVKILVVSKGENY